MASLLRKKRYAPPRYEKRSKKTRALNGEPESTGKGATTHWIYVRFLVQLNKRMDDNISVFQRDSKWGSQLFEFNFSEQRELFFCINFGQINLPMQMKVRGCAWSFRTAIGSFAIGFFENNGVTVPLFPINEITERVTRKVWGIEIWNPNEKWCLSELHGKFMTILMYKDSFSETWFSYIESSVSLFIFD